MITIEMKHSTLVEKAYDKKLHIQTTVVREWSKDKKTYNRYELTPFLLFKILFIIYITSGWSYD